MITPDNHNDDHDVDKTIIMMFDKTLMVLSGRASSACGGGGGAEAPAARGQHR
jgi:hypothetical protein